MKANRFLLIAAIATLALLCIGGSQVKADMGPPLPRTAWKRGQSPSESSVVIAGIAMSAAIVAGGLLFARLSFSKSRVAAIAFVALASLAVAGVFFGARHYLGLIGDDQEKWAQWEDAKLKRRRGGGPTEEDIHRVRMSIERAEAAKRLWDERQRRDALELSQDKYPADQNGEKLPLADDR